MQLVISTKEGKAYSKKVEDAGLNGKKIGEEISLEKFGLQGYSAKITGGSDKQGFPMRHDLPGTQRKKIMAAEGIGFRASVKGQKKRVSVRGNTVSDEIAQLNLAVTKQGTVPLEQFAEKTAKTEDASAKDRLVKESLENVGNVELAGDAHKTKGKVRK
ncbi:MAG: 30S ribosomal protein S6e [archaeon]